MSSRKSFSDLLRIVDADTSKTQAALKRKNRPISCHRGCDHCCHLLVEATWDEAVLIADWIEKQPSHRRSSLKRKLNRAAKERRELFSRRKSTERYRRPTRSSVEISSPVCHEYFYEKRRPCPFLEDSVCSAYPVRPSACRLHMVTSPADHCSRDSEEDIDIPAEISVVRKRVERTLVPHLSDARWGELAIMVVSALEER